MVNELFELFGVRQAVHDLTQVVLQTSTRSFDRIASLAPPDRVLSARAGLAWIAGQEVMRFDGPKTDAAHDAVRLAAALPGDGFEMFVASTALLLLDRLNGGRRSSDLHWYFEPFAKDYARALPWHRAALFNGFRTAVRTKRIVLDSDVSDAMCYTSAQADVLRSIADHYGMSTRVRSALLGNTSAEEAGALWSAYASDPHRDLVPAFRYLYERPVSLQTPPGQRAPVIPVVH